MYLESVTIYDSQLIKGGGVNGYLEFESPIMLFIITAENVELQKPGCWRRKFRCVTGLKP